MQKRKSLLAEPGRPGAGRASYRVRHGAQRTWRRVCARLDFAYWGGWLMTEETVTGVLVWCDCLKSARDITTPKRWLLTPLKLFKNGLYALGLELLTTRPFCPLCQVGRGGNPQNQNSPSHQLWGWQDLEVGPLIIRPDDEFQGLPAPQHCGE